MKTIGLIREGKKPFDKRVALTPIQCIEVMERFSDVRVIVQPSAHRCIPDSEYIAAGIELTEDLSSCDVLLGITESSFAIF